jgi:peptidoglycan/xylan/chitin deacetylase (PgdA/CDA1 family)
MVADDDHTGDSKPASDNTSRGQTNSDMGTVPTSGNLIVNPSAEEIGSDSGLPRGWQNNVLGDNDAKFGTVTGFKSQRALAVSITNYKNGDANWYHAAAPTGGARYFQYSDYYRSGVPTQVILVTTDAAGKDSYTQLRQAPASANWASYVDRFLVPAGTTQIRVFHSLGSRGTLYTDNLSLTATTFQGWDQGMVSLTFDDGWGSVYGQAFGPMKEAGVTSTQYVISGYVGAKGYMTANQLYEMQRAGHEIASHSASHFDVPVLTVRSRDYELAHSRDDLSKCFGTINNYAAPYGTYSPSVVDTASTIYRSYRSTDDGYNTADSFDVYGLKVKNIETSTSSQQLASWLETARQHKLWLILVYHQVDGSDSIYSRRPERFRQDLVQIKASGLEVVTVNQGLDAAAAQRSR